MYKLKLAALVFALAALTAVAQTSRGTVTGVVTDSTKASVPGATVEIRNRETNVTRGTTANQEGIYRFDAVDPGAYDLTIKATGFKTFTTRQISVAAAQIIGVDAQLEVGENANVIEVTADAIALQTESPVRGGTITTAQITTLPFFSRNPALLAVTLPGVTEKRADLPGVATFSVNGARGRSNNFLLDGTENNDISVTGQGFQVTNPDTVQEVSVQTANYDAEFGRAGGAVVNVITKSGTNDFHGTLGWVADFTNDDALTNTLASDPSVKKLPPGYEQFYNGTLGGPIVRNKTFFFTSWQEQRRRATRTAAFTTLSALGRQQLRSVFPEGTNPRADLYLDVTKGVIATGQFTDIDLGNGRGAAQFGTGILGYPLKLDGRQSLSKIDHRFSDNDLLSLRYGYDRTINPTAGVNFPGFFTSSQQHYHNVLLTETHIFSPTLTNEFRLPYNRIGLDSPNDATDPRAATMPLYTFQTVTDIGIQAGFPQGRIANNYGLQDTMSWVKGRHTLRFGFDLLQQRSRQFAPIVERGQLVYNSSNVNGQAYTSFANFLDDFGGSGAALRDFGTAAYYPELFRQAYFFTDRWQMRENLTVTLGMRWEDFGTPANSVRTAAFAGLFNVKVAPPTKTFTAPMKEPSKTVHDLNNFAPTIGITWSPRFQHGILGKIFGDRRSVFRTGYNIGYDSFFNNIASNAQTSAPNVVATSTPSVPSAASPRGLANLSQKFPSTPRDVLPIDAQTITTRDFRNPYYQRWSFGIQREMPWGLVLDSSYVGSSGTRLYISEDMNPQVVNPALRVLPAGFTSLEQLQSALPAGYLLQPRLDPLQGSRAIRSNGGHSSYHSAQFQLTKRFTRDVGFSLAYTWSKLLDNGTDPFGYNNSTPLAAVPFLFGGDKLEKAVSLYDRPYRLVLTWYYQLPFMKSQHGAIGRVLGGWSLGSVVTLESGVPYNVSNGVDADGIGGASDRPDINPNGKPGVRARPAGNGYVNPDVLGANGAPVPIDPAEARYIGLPTCTLATLATCRTGNAGRNTERTPGIRNADLNAFKTIRITEKLSLEFRGEFYNVFNHPQHGYPSVSPFSSLVTTPASNVTGSTPGRFLNLDVLDAGGRVIRYNLTLRF